MMIFAVVATKGGVGKTTVAASVAAMYADLGYKVLLIDTDYQPALSNFYEISDRAPQGLTSLLIEGQLRPEMISAIAFPPSEGYGDARKGRLLHPNGRVDIVYSDATPDGQLRVWLDNRITYYRRLRTALRTPWVQDNYDLVIIDTQGASGKLQDAAAVAADRLILPVTPDALSARAFLAETMAFLDRIASAHEHDRAPITYALLYRQTNTNNARAYSSAIRDHYLDLRGGVSVLNIVIPHSTVFERAASQRLPVHWLDRRAHELMHRLAWELVPQTYGQTDGDSLVHLNGNLPAESPLYEPLSPHDECN